MKKVYCSGENTGCDHEDKPTLKECSDCPYMSTIKPMQGIGKQMSEQKRLDRPDREKITDWIYDALKEIEIEEQIRLSDRAFIADLLAPKLLALIPDELAFNPDYLDFQKGVEATKKIWEVKIEEAKKEERERIFRWVDEYLQPRYSPHDHRMYFKNVAEVTWGNFWQALSQEEE